MTPNRAVAGCILLGIIGYTLVILTAITLSAVIGGP